MLKRSQPIFAVRDVKETIAFYQDILGFDNPWFWGDPVTFGGIHCGDVQIMFNRQPDLAKHIEGHQHHFWEEKIDELHAQHLAAGAKVISPIDNKPWGLREYTVLDPNGYHLRFSGPEKYERPPTATDTIPQYIQIEPRLPTPQEFGDLSESVNWNGSQDKIDCLAKSLLGATAIDTRTGKAVGMARAMQDARGWYSIWDVVVRPEYQSQRIGTAVMEGVMAQLRQRGPAGAAVFLFTMKPAFYSRLGFADGTCTMTRL